MTDKDSTDHRPEDSTEEPEIESKSQRKRNAHMITQLAGELVAMKPKALADLPIEQNIQDAIRQCAEIKAHGARKRQLHFVSKLLRESSTLEELQSALERPDLTKKIKSETNPHLGFRNQLIDNFGDQVELLREKYPAADLQQVRQLVRNAHSESKKAGTKPAADTNESAVENGKTATDQNDAQPMVKPSNTKSAKALLKLLSASQGS